MGLKLTLTGFDEYLSDLKKAGKNVDEIATKALEQSGDILYNALKDSVKSSGMSEDTIREINNSLMKPTIHKNYEGGEVANIVCETGFRLGAYNPDDPSGGFIALFNEYGTKDRSTRSGESRGSLVERTFTRRAIKKTSSKIKKLQKKILEEGLEEIL